jgi:EAL domain-containing protein (putative c-di-GMP-specific phosphodiesterase class I)
LREMGCSIFQGFLFSKPVAAAELDMSRDSALDCG